MSAPARTSEAGHERAREPAPVISVVVCSYNSRERIRLALDSLRAQDLEEPYEVLVVDSGGDGCAEFLRAAYPEVRVVRSEHRLRPGAARNRGVEAARGEYVAFLPDDGLALPDWLRRRVTGHRGGYEAIGGAIVNGTPRHPVGSAGYFLEYSALIPSGRVLAEQGTPHCLSYRRELFERLGGFPEGTDTGEDTLFNERLVAARTSIAFDPSVRLAHRNLTRIGPYLLHQYRHGRGLVQCAELTLSGGRSAAGGPDQPPGLAAARLFALYPARRWSSALGRLARGRPRWVAGYLLVSPLVWAGLWATAAGAWRERRALRRA